MNGRTVSRDDRDRLASYIGERRRELVASVVRSPGLARPRSIGSSAFANAFLDRLCLELQSDIGASLDAWALVEAATATATEFARIVAISCALISAGYVADCGHNDDVVAYLAQRSSEIERQFRAERTEFATRVDSIASRGRDEVVSSLLSAMDARDRETSEHSRAVAMWCGRIAKTLGMDAEQQAQAALAGLLHDIGKVATPSEILLKPGPLDAAEWEEVRAHVAIGAKILERIASLRELADAVRCHHERVDGTGYPRGLSGESIPLLARIVAVADAFHAMISKRPYRDALPVGIALAELRAGSGSQWDSRIVDAMLAVVQPSAKRQAIQAAKRA